MVEEGGEGVFDALGGVRQEIVCLRVEAVRTDGFYETGHSLAVFLRHDRRRRGDAFIRLAVREIHGFVEWKGDFIMVENMEQHGITMAEV